MKKPLMGIVVLLFCLAWAPAQSMAGAGKTLKPFESDAEFLELLAKWKHEAAQRRDAADQLAAKAAKPSPPPPAAPALQVTGAVATESTTTSITNVQTQGVDEGDIVKQHGDYLIVLRRGRLFTIRIGGDQLMPISTINAYAPDADPAGTWYDEMLISDGRIVVIGYSYSRGGTEIGVFDLDKQGHIAYRATYQMRSNDYYSSRNYASRLIGHQLIFYSPLYINPYANDPFAAFPALRRWHSGTTPADFQRILPANRIYRSTADFEYNGGLALHSVSLCDLDQPVMQCRSTAVLGPAGRVFYVSNDAVYVWTTSWADKSANNSSVFRIPLDGSEPSGIRTSGSPIDQMSFLQRDGYLNVLLGRASNGEAMWAANGDAGRLALMRVRLADFGDGSGVVPPQNYRAMPNAGAWQYGVQNRYIGDWLVYGSASANLAHAFQFAAFGTVQDIPLDHPVERVDALGSDAILVGSKGADLHFTSVALKGNAPVIGTFVQTNAAQGDQRTHGFFYRPDSDMSGVVGLPIERHGGDSAAVLYLQNRALQLSKLGSLESHAKAGTDDACKASCVDWYGNARPIFIGYRVFALLGYELVEGRVDAEAITERRRADFSPVAAQISR
jgi:hypothetical protein